MKTPWEFENDLEYQFDEEEVFYDKVHKSKSK